MNNDSGKTKDKTDRRTKTKIYTQKRENHEYCI